ncbi:MAG TPA: TRAP transporter substrate-binding protein [Gallionellaceae bacterium]|nr:TRAP transporter substrate-binding protein [Gallionellaceae bacterium]
MKKINVLLGILLLSISAMSLAEPVVIKFSHVVAPDTPKGKAAEKFKQLVEERSKGAMKVEIYPNSQLYKDREELEALQLGAVQMLAPSMAKFGPLGAREFELFDLPFMFPNKETLYRTMDGVVGKRLFNKLETKGIVGLAYWDNGFKQMSANKPMHRVADFNGLKMRIQSSKVLDAQMKALGAMPQVMAFSEVYTALQQGVVDGTENPLSNVYTQKMHEVQKHMTMSDHGYLGYAVITNKKFWDGLTADQRNLIAQAMKEATVYERSIAQQENDESLAKIRAAKTTEIYTLTDAERAEWMKALLPVHKEFEGVVGKENLQEVYDIAAQVAKEAAPAAKKLATKR